MRRTSWIAAGLSGSAALALLALGRPAWVLPLAVGAAWGLANMWCIARIVTGIAQGRGKAPLAGWLAVKFVGLYGLAAWLLIGARVPAVPWLAGFTLALAAAGAAAFPAVRPLFSSTRNAAFLAAFLFPAAAHAAEAAHGEAAPAHPPEIPNLITLIHHWSHGPVAKFLHTYENPIFAVTIALIVGGLIALGVRRLAMQPGRGQMFVEMLVEGLDNLVCGVLGKKEGRKYLPFLGTLFIFILSMNLAGLVPGFKSPTSSFFMTVALGFCVFVKVQWTGIQRLGLGGYVDHLIGQPRDPVGWILSPLMLFIHGIGEIVKPLSLALRLFGNIMGEDTLLGVFVTLGALTFAWSHLPIGIPLHLPFVLLALIFSIVQALVFTMLSTIYIFMMLPHEAHGHDEHNPRPEGPVEAVSDEAHAEVPAPAHSH